MKYIYGMRLRGFAPGCQPKENFVERRDDPSGRYWDLIVYSVPLMHKEQRFYDLDFIKTEE